MAVDSIRLPNGDVVIFDEWLHWPLFSTIEFASTDGIRLRCFSYVVGQNVPRTSGLAARSATPADTNQVAKSRMNWDETFRVFSMTYETWGLGDISITDASPDDLVAEFPMISSVNLRRLQRDLIVELRVGADIEKAQIRAPFSYYHQGLGPVMYPCGDAPAANVNISAGTGGDVAWASQRRYAFPVAIGQDRIMQLLIFSAFGTVAGLDQSVRMRWYLDGLKRRPLG